MNPQLFNNVRSHWGYCVALSVVAVDLFIAFGLRGQISPRVMEAGILFDLAVFVPCLYWLCYRERGRKSVIRAAALCCLGIWAALKVVPESERELLNYVAHLRYVGLVVLACLEGAVLVAIYRTVFKGLPERDAIAQAHAAANLPTWVARLLVLEAKFWRSVWLFIKRCMGGK
jgi:hypothetical protein